MNVYINIDRPMLTKGKPYKVHMDYLTSIIIIDDNDRPYHIDGGNYTVVNNNTITNREFYLEDYSNSIPN